LGKGLRAPQSAEEGRDDRNTQVVQQGENRKHTQSEVRNRKMRAKRVILLILISILVVGFLPSQAQVAEDTATPPAGYTPVMAEEKLGNSEVLLIRDYYPWNQPSNELALQDVGKTFAIINSGNLAVTDLSMYSIVMLASDQNTLYYQNIANNILKIEAFVNHGGVYIAHACDIGWHSGNWANLNIMPGGVTRVSSYRQDIQITDPTNPVVNGPYGVLTNALLSGWDWSTHGWFTNVPAGANIVMTTGSSLAQPTYIVYNFGSGRVQASMQTIEHGYFAHNAQAFLRNEIKYAQVPPGPIPLFSDVLAMLSLGLVACTMVIRRRRKYTN